MKYSALWQSSALFLAGANFALPAIAQVPAVTLCQIHAEKSRAVFDARLGLRPTPVDPRYDLSVNAYTNVPKDFVTLRAWIKANPRHLCTPDALALIARREAKIAELSRNRTPGAQQAKWIRTSYFNQGDFSTNAGEQDGRVTIKLFVEADGKPEQCIVTRHSGNSRFDTQTCRLFLRRGHFEPARDTNGLPVNSWIEQSINWAVDGGVELIRR